MSKNKIWLHLTIFLILLMGTTYFAYEAFAPSEEKILNENKQEQTEEKKEQFEEEKTYLVKNETDDKQEILNTKIENTAEINLETKSIAKTEINTSTKNEIKKSLPYSATIVVNGKSYEVNFAEQEITLKNLMDKLQQESDFSYSGKEYSGMGFFVEEINGIKNSSKENKYWIYYKNGKSANVGISNQKINSEDKIEWKYEESNF